MSKFIFLVPIYFLFSASLLGQIDLSKTYQPLRATGKVPDAFRQSTSTKIAQDHANDLEDLTKKQETVFLESIHYGIDELLNSGLVLYGDVATKYVEKVGRNLLKQDRDLNGKIQFYVLKSNVTNALSTDQGIIFVTLGLLSQIENEAQLAYVLAHEIAHYQEKHVRKSFSESVNQDYKGKSYDERITGMSNHSKERELEADNLGIKLYHKAGYDKNELLTTFDVLMYSYLPFDEEILPKDYFNNDRIYVPHYLFPEEINPILIEEDYDDSKSSHPNIRKRKDAIHNVIEKYSNWGNKTNIIDQNEFDEVRSIARFESLRIDLFNHQFGDALYSAFLLEKEFPNNLFLARAKAQAWLGMSSFTIENKKSKTIQKVRSVEGESHAMHHFLNKLSKEQVLVVAMRKITDALEQFPDDPELKEINNRMIGNLARYSKFTLGDYQNINYETAQKEFEVSKQGLAEEDSISSNSENSDEELSKYEKIKIKREGKIATSEDDDFDEKKFHLFALSDLVEDENFKRKFRSWKDKFDEEEEKEKETTKKQSKSKKEKTQRYSDLTLLEPSFEITERGIDQLSSAESLESRIVKTVHRMGAKLNVSVNDLSNENIEKRDTYGYNERAMLMDYLRQVADYDEVDMFPVDYSYLQDLQANYGDGRLLFIYGDYANNSKISIGMGIIGTLFPPLGIPYFASKILGGHLVDINAVYIDLNNGTIEKSQQYTFVQKPSDRVLEGFVYDMLSH